MLNTSTDKQKQKLKSSHSTPLEHTSTFGELVPYGDPSWYQQWRSPYYNQSHANFRAALRKFCEEELEPNVSQWDERKEIPREIWKKFGSAGFLAAVIGPPWPTEYVGDKMGGNVRPEEFDYFHELIVHDEVSRLGSGGLVWGLFIGLCIGLPPIMRFGSKYLQEKVLSNIISAITTEQAKLVTLQAEENEWRMQHNNEEHQRLEHQITLREARIAELDAEIIKKKQQMDDLRQELVQAEKLVSNMQQQIEHKKTEILNANLVAAQEHTAQVETVLHRFRHECQHPHHLLRQRMLCSEKCRAEATALI